MAKQEERKASGNVTKDDRRERAHFWVQNSEKKPQEEKILSSENKGLIVRYSVEGRPYHMIGRALGAIC